VRLAAAHQAGHIAMALGLGWQVRKCSITHVELRPGHFQPLDLAMINLAGDVAVKVLFDRDFLIRGAVFHKLTHFDPELARVIDRVRYGGAPRVAACGSYDIGAAIALLIDDDPGAEPAALIKTYRLLEIDVTQVLTRRARDLAKIANRLLH